jgi:heme exporter protein A
VFVGHASGVKDDLTAAENVRVSAALSGRSCSLQQALAALEAVGLGPRSNLPARVLSQGQRRRVALARLAIAPVAPLLILDEPFNALDQESVQVLSSWLNRQLADGAQLVYTTHQSQPLQASRHHEIELGEGA